MRRCALLLLLLLLLVACTSPTEPSYVYRLDAAGVAVTVWSYAPLAETELSIVGRGVQRGDERYLRCHDTMPPGWERATVEVRERYPVDGDYEVRGRVMRVLRSTLSWTHEAVEHERADHDLPLLAGDRRWQLYDHGLPAVCT